LFVDGNIFYSHEGTTQGDPLTMPFYAFATLLLVHKLNNSINQIWYADDAAAIGSLAQLRSEWDRIVTLGPRLWLPSKCLQYVAGLPLIRSWLTSKMQSPFSRALG